MKQFKQKSDKSSVTVPSDSFDDDDRENHDPNGLNKRRTLPVKQHELGSLQTRRDCIFAVLIEQFRIACLNDKPENGALVLTLQKRTLFSAIQVMLRLSERA